MKTKLLTICVMLVMLVFGVTATGYAATPEEVEQAIQKGVAWLLGQQNGDGSWGNNEQVARTGFAVVKLEERAFELGYESPFDAAYPHRQQVIDGLNYIFSQAGTYGAGSGFHFASGGHETYNTGIAMMAIAASRDPARVVNVPGSLVDGMTYAAVLQANVDFFAWSQYVDGGWRYHANEESSDNSNTGYAVLGLRYAEAPAFGFESTLPPSLKTGLDSYVNHIQNDVNGDSDDGGSGYTSGDDGWVNLLKTGNLLFEMSFVGDGSSATRVQDAIDYIERHWNDNNPDPGWRNPYHYQSMYCMMKGFESLGVDEITVGGSPVDWYQEFASAIVASQLPDGSWPGDNWGDSVLTTEWSLLVLEKVAPPPPVDVQIDVPACACDGNGYDVDITYSVERFVVDGTLRIYKDNVEVESVPLQNFTGVGNHTHSVPVDTPGTYSWKVVLEVTPVGGGTPAEAQDEAAVKVCQTPVVGGIPDQVAPFVPFDLDDYLTYGGGLPVVWATAGVPDGWTVDIDADNVVVVTAPEGANDPQDITFTAAIECCDQVECSSSDTATFTPNQPPVCTEAYGNPELIWPPNHQFVPIDVLGVTDPDGDPVTITVGSIWQDEPVDTHGDGSFTPDGQGVGTPTAHLRAERSGTKKVPGDGRVYHISFTASDGRGGQCEGTVLVGVPHDKKDTPVDGGAMFDSTALAP